MDNIDISQNSYGAFLRSSSGLLTNSTVTTKCNAIDTNSHLVANGQNYTFVISDNTITPTDGAGITAYDGAIVVAKRNTISGAAQGSGFAIRSSFVTANHNIVGPIGIGTDYDCGELMLVQRTTEFSALPKNRF